MDARYPPLSSAGAGSAARRWGGQRAGLHFATAAFLGKACPKTVACHRESKELLSACAREVQRAGRFGWGQKARETRNILAATFLSVNSVSSCRHIDDGNRQDSSVLQGPFWVHDTSIDPWPALCVVAPSPPPPRQPLVKQLSPTVRPHGAVPREKHTAGEGYALTCSGRPKRRRSSASCARSALDAAPSMRHRRAPSRGERSRREGLRDFMCGACRPNQRCNTPPLRRACASVQRLGLHERLLLPPARCSTYLTANIGQERLSR